MRSKLEKQIYHCVHSVFPDAQHSRWLTVDDITYVFDIYVPSIKTFIEVNGDYWHLNPELYEPSHYDSYRDVVAQDIWNKDTEKLLIAQSLGFNIVVVWENKAHEFDPKQLQADQSNIPIFKCE